MFAEVAGNLNFGRTPILPNGNFRRALIFGGTLILAKLDFEPSFLPVLNFSPNFCTGPKFGQNFLTILYDREILSLRRLRIYKKLNFLINSIIDFFLFKLNNRNHNPDFRIKEK